MAYLMHAGSVKDFYVIRDPTDDTFGRGYFNFKQRPDGTGPISIFDLKHRFPFGVRGKDQAMCDESVHFLQLMAANQVPTHYNGHKAGSKIGVYVAHIPPREGWEDWVKARGRKPFLVPMEVIISSTITPVASLHKRLRTGKAIPGDYGLSRVPERYESVTPPKPVVTTSTKLEEHDTYRDDLWGLIGLTGEKKAELVDLAMSANSIARADAANCGLDIADGKFEFVMGPDGRLYIADAYMTSDENRLLAKTRDGRDVDVSKQFLRNIYTITGYREQLEARQDGGVPFDEWPLPGPLDERTMGVVEKSYRVVHQELCRMPMGLDLTEVATEVQDTLDRFKDMHKRDETGAPL